MTMNEQKCFLIILIRCLTLYFHLRKSEDPSSYLHEGTTKNTAREDEHHVQHLKLEEGPIVLLLSSTLLKHYKGVPAALHLMARFLRVAVYPDHSKTMTSRGVGETLPNRPTPTRCLKTKQTPNTHLKIPSIITFLLIYLTVPLSFPGAVSSDTLQAFTRKSLLAADAPSWFSPPLQAMVLQQSLGQTWVPCCPAPVLLQSSPKLLVKTQRALPAKAAFFSFSWE